MKARNLFFSFFALLALTWSGALFAAGAPTQVAMNAPTVNINEADAKTLATVLDGVGMHRAEAIVLYHNKNGKFYSAEELTAVKGIGKGTVARNEKKIVTE